MEIGIDNSTAPVKPRYRWGGLWVMAIQKNDTYNHQQRFSGFKTSSFGSRKAADTVECAAPCVNGDAIFASVCECAIHVAACAQASEKNAMALRL